MGETSCHPEQSPNRAAAKELILKKLGVKRVAGWTGVEEDTVYQWLSRATEEEPFPPARVTAVVLGAKAENLDAPLSILMPSLSVAAQ